MEATPEVIQPQAPELPFKIIKGKAPGNWSMMIYGTPGVGKSTLATYAPKPFFIDLEGGLDRIDCERTNMLQKLEDLMSVLRWAYKTNEYRTIVIDTADACENLLVKQILEENPGKSSIADFGYGQGYDLLNQKWKDILMNFDAIKSTGKNILMIGHDVVQKYEDPAMDNYDRYTINVQKKAAPLITARMDAVLFACHEKILLDRPQKGKKRAIGTGKAVLNCLEAPSWVAKNRFGLPATIDMDKSLFEKIQ